MQVGVLSSVTPLPDGLSALTFPTLYGWLCDTEEEHSKGESHGDP